MAFQNSVSRKLVLIFSSFLIFSCSSNNEVTTEKKTEENKPLSKAESVNLFNSNCATCHGADGKLGLSGAKDLSKSNLSDEVIKQMVLNGKNAMPSFEGMIKEGNQLNAIVEHVKSLRK